MTSAEAKIATTTGTYLLSGTIVEACTCQILCPCWVGEDPDGGTCDGVLAYNIERGQIGGLDVSGLTVAMAAHFPGNIFNKDSRAVLFVDERATPEQFEALVDTFQGRLGGPAAAVAEAVIGEWLGVYQVPIEFDLAEAEGSITIGTRIRTAVEPYRSPYGEVTTLRDSIFSTIPGSPAWVGKSKETSVELPDHDMAWSVQGRNAIQGQFRFEA
jgi:hypothetical protein